MKDVIANWVLDSNLFNEYTDKINYEIRSQQDQIELIFKELKEAQHENEYLRFAIENPEPKIGAMVGENSEECIIEVNLMRYFTTPTQIMIKMLNWEVKTFNKNTNKITTYSDFRG